MRKISTTCRFRQNGQTSVMTSQIKSLTKSKWWWRKASAWAAPGCGKPIWSIFALTFLGSRAGRRLVSQWETDGKSQHQETVWLRLQSTIRWRSDAACVSLESFACMSVGVCSGCSVCRQIQSRLARFKRWSRANSWLAGIPLGHRWERWREESRAGYKYVLHQSCETQRERHC